MLNPRIIAFYLPQYHPIPENDKWWGKGFTDWVNVKKAKPRFIGHYQPHIPVEMDYYDLRDEAVRLKQAKLANEYGISGFCYYHYWFNGKMLLEKPFDEILKSGKPDFPFCICWANENWTRTWDGLNEDCLMIQDYNKYDALEHISWLEHAFSDRRYIRINDRPLLLIYNAGDIIDLKIKINTWKQYIKEKGYKGIYLCSVKSVHNLLSDDEIIKAGFDAIVDFIPNGRDIPRLKFWNLPRSYANRLFNKIIRILHLETKIKYLPISYVYDYKSLVKKKINKPVNNHKTFPCIIPGWDNSARRNIAYIMQNDSENLYKIWLEKSIDKVRNFPFEEQIVFINAWNEWAEGCHMEPDVRNGKKFLEATLEVVKKLNL